MAKPLSRGLRNNNPLNIRKGDNWQGLAPVQSDPDFCIFTSTEWGLRAAFVILLNYLKKKVDTPDKIIKRWAPPTENKTESYIEFVCSGGYLDRHSRILKSDKQKLCRLVWAMAQYECGSIISFGLIENAYSLALR